MIRQLRDADIHLLRVFVAVAESGGLAAAQDRLNVAASTISTQISNLETRLGFRLCKRGRAGFSLTPQGEVVLQASYKLMLDMSVFVNTIEATRGDLVGKVKITLIDNTIRHPSSNINAVLHALRENYPFLQIEMRQRSPARIENALIKREIDVGVSWFASTMPSLIYTTIFQEEHVICCGKGHPLFDLPNEAISPDLLEATDWVSRSYDLPRNIHFSSPSISTAMSDNMEGIAQFILARTHIGYLPLQYASTWLEKGEMKILLPDVFNYSLDMQIAIRSESMTDKRIATVRDIILESHNVI